MRERERLHSQFFADWLWEQHAREFIVHDPGSEDSEIDVILEDKSLPAKIKLQCVAYRGEGLIYAKPDVVSIPENASAEFKKIFENLVGVLVPAQFDKKQSILDYIRKKEGRYPDELLRELTLIIEATVPSVSPEELAKLFPDGIESRFNGIYFVQLPIPFGDPKLKYDATGFVYPLKSAMQ